MKLFSLFGILFFCGNAWASPQSRTSIPLQTAASTTAQPSPQAGPTPLARSQVFFVSSERVVTPQMKIDSRLVRVMLGALLCAVTHQPDVKKAWQSLLKVGKEGDRVGIKVATEPGMLAGTHLQLVEALVAELVEAAAQRVGLKRVKKD